MDSYSIAFCFLSIVHGLFGYVLFCFALSEEIQKPLFYANTNPLVGDIHKYIVYFTYGSLAACGFMLQYSYKISLIAAWAATGIYLFGALTIPLLRGSLPRANKPAVVNLAIRIAGASTLTYLFLHATRS